MTDFYQTGVIATLHRLVNPDVRKLESEIECYASERPIALVLPSLFSELQGEALKNIVDELKKIKYLNEIVVTLGPCNEEEFKFARKFFSVLPQRTRLIWNSGSRMERIFRKIEEADLYLGTPGKGKSAWIAYGYIISRNSSRVIALHDCDILTYNKDLLTRLVYPTTSPNLDYDFCKGFYSRVTDRLHGRVTRLLVTPLIRSLEKILGYLPILVFFDSFRYPLAGEFSMNVELARINRIPSDWGLEIGVLAEVYRNTSVRRVCQVDIAENYEHKHQPLSPEDSSMGLHKMCVDICKTLFRTLAAEGIVFSNGLFRSLLATYVRTAQDMLKRFEDDARINCLFFDRHSESLAVETFSRGLMEASTAFLENPIGIPLIPSWDRVTSAIEGIFDEIENAIEEDNR